MKKLLIYSAMQILFSLVSFYMGVNNIISPAQADYEDTHLALFILVSIMVLPIVIIKSKEYLESSLMLLVENMVIIIAVGLILLLDQYEFYSACYVMFFVCGGNGALLLSILVCVFKVSSKKMALVHILLTSGITSMGMSVIIN